MTNFKVLIIHIVRMVSPDLAVIMLVLSITAWRYVYA
jgi:hypothetical protein